MADEQPPAPAPLPEKPASQSVSMWAAVATAVLGFATTLGVTGDVVEFAKGNVEQIIGVIVSVVGLVSAYGAARRKTTLKL